MLQHKRYHLVRFNHTIALYNWIHPAISLTLFIGLSLVAANAQLSAFNVHYALKPDLLKQVQIELFWLGGIKEPCEH